MYKICSSSVLMIGPPRVVLTAPPIYYVPVLRATDNCTPPQLTPPCTIAEFDQRQGTLTDDRGTPMIGQAFAGPMSPAQVDIHIHVLQVCLMELCILHIAGFTHEV